MEKCFHKSCVELNFVQKTQRSLSLCLTEVQFGASKNFEFLTYYNALGGENTYISGLNAAKNIEHIEKCIKRKLHRIKFRTRNSMDVYLYLYQEWS